MSAIPSSKVAFRPTKSKLRIRENDRATQQQRWLANVRWQNKPDLLLGSENGRIYHIAHADCNRFSEIALQAKPAKIDADQKIPCVVSAVTNRA